MFALVFENKVVQIEEKPFPVASALVWIDISQIEPKPENDWLFDGKKFIPPPVPSTQDQAALILPVLEKKVLYALAQRVAGEITQEQLMEKWQELKGKMEEAGIFEISKS